MIKVAKNEKAKKFKLFLEKNKLEFFHISEKSDGVATVVFKTAINVQGQMLPLLYFTDNTIYTLIKVQLISHAANKSNIVRLMHYINELNTIYKISKYSINTEKDIILEIPLPYADNFFDARIALALIKLTADNVQETYPEFVRLICGRHDFMKKPFDK